MALPKIESRIAALEAEVAQLKRRLNAATNPPADWLDEITGVFAGDPIHEEAVRLGREYRESLRPKTSENRRKVQRI